MIKRAVIEIKSCLNGLRAVFNQLKNQSAYEVISTHPCQQSGQHMIEVKVTGKSQSITYFAEEIVKDNNFIMGFTPADIRTIVYLATCDRYEEILRNVRTKKPYELIRARSKARNKTVQLIHKETNENILISLADLSSSELIDNLESQDAYYLGYLAGQEQMLKDSKRLKLISRQGMGLPCE